MKNEQIASILVLFALPAWLGAAQSRPNIVFILADALGDGVALAAGAWNPPNCSLSDCSDRCASWRTDIARLFPLDRGIPI